MEGAGSNATAQNGTQAVFSTDFDLPTIHDWPFPTLPVESSRQGTGDGTSSLTTLTDSSDSNRPNAIGLLASGQSLGNSSMHAHGTSTDKPIPKLRPKTLPLRTPGNTGHNKVESSGMHHLMPGDPGDSHESNGNQREEEEEEEEDDDDDDSECQSEDYLLQAPTSKGSSGQRWSATDDKLLIDLVEQGASVAEACKPFPQRTVQGVCQHAKKLKERGLIAADISPEIRSHSSQILSSKQEKTNQSLFSSANKSGKPREKIPNAWSKEEEDILIKGYLAGVTSQELLSHLPRRSTVKSLQNHLSKLKNRGHPELQSQELSKKRTSSSAFSGKESAGPAPQQRARSETRLVKTTSDNLLFPMASTAGPNTAVTIFDTSRGTDLQRDRRGQAAAKASPSASAPALTTVAAPAVHLRGLPDNAELEQRLLILGETRKRMEKTRDLANQIREEQNKIKAIKADIIRALRS